MDDPFSPPIPIPNVLFQGKNSVSPNVWPGGELVHGDRNRAWLDDNKIVSACSYVCVCPTGTVGEDAGVGRPRPESAASLLCLALVFLEGCTSSPK